jgi:hypothetical protein
MPYVYRLENHPYLNLIKPFGTAPYLKFPEKTNGLMKLLALIMVITKIKKLKLQKR